MRSAFLFDGDVTHNHNGVAFPQENTMRNTRDAILAAAHAAGRSRTEVSGFNELTPADQDKLVNAILAHPALTEEIVRSMLLAMPAEEFAEVRAEFAAD